MSPTQPPEPTATTIPAGSPPPAVLEIASVEQAAGIGIYCWPLPAAGGESVPACVDKVGLPTSPDSLIAESPITARLTLSMEQPPAQLQLSVFPVVSENEVKMDNLPAEFRFWMPAEGISQELEQQTSQDIQLELEPVLLV